MMDTPVAVISSRRQTWESNEKIKFRWYHYTLLKKKARGVLGLRGVTAQGVLWQIHYYSQVFIMGMHLISHIAQGSSILHDI